MDPASKGAHSTLDDFTDTDHPWHPGSPAETLESLGKVLAHETRHKIITMCIEDDEVSMKQISDQLSVSFKTAKYHVEYLVSHGYLQLIRTEQVRGMVRNIYAMHEDAKALVREILAVLERRAA